MSTAEQKVELVRRIVEADEETTNRMMEMTMQINHPTTQFADVELAKFHVTRDQYLSDTSNTILLEDAHTYIRSLKHK